MHVHHGVTVSKHGTNQCTCMQTNTYQHVHHTTKINIDMELAVAQHYHVHIHVLHVITSMTSDLKSVASGYLSEGLV